MFAFGAQYENGFNFVQTSEGHTYTYVTEALAREYFDCVKSHAHLYQVDPDLQQATLVEQGDNVLPSPEQVQTTEKQRLALWESFPYKSLLAWAPIPEAF
jgi:hypothetical protein